MSKHEKQQTFPTKPSQITHFIDPQTGIHYPTNLPIHSKHLKLS